MRTLRSRWPHSGALVLAVGWCASLAIGAVMPERPDPPGRSRSAPKAARPSPEHDLLQRDVGIWDATIQVAGEPGTPPEVSNGVETNTLAAGGLWLLSRFESRLMGQPFEGHGILGYDKSKGKYVRLWVDSSQPIFWPAEGTYDPETDTLTLWMAGTDSDGNIVRWRSEMAWKGDDTRSFTMYLPGDETTEAAGMTITYRRRKR